MHLCLLHFSLIVFIRCHWPWTNHRQEKLSSFFPDYTHWTCVQRASFAIHPAFWMERWDWSRLWCITILLTGKLCLLLLLLFFVCLLLLLGFLSEGSATVLNFVNKVAVIFRLCIFFPNKTVLDPLDILTSTIMLVSIKLTMESEREEKSLHRSRLSVRRR